MEVKLPAPIEFVETENEIYINETAIEIDTQ